MASKDKFDTSFQFPLLPVRDDAFFFASEADELQRAATLSDDDFKLLVQVDLGYVAHGQSPEGPVTLLVIRFRLIGVTLNRRLRNVDFTVQFQEEKNQKLRVARFWPKGYFALNTAKVITMDASTDGMDISPRLASTPGTTTWAELSKDEYDVENRIRLHGHRGRRNNIIHLSLSENKFQESGPVTELRTAILVTRSNDENFVANISVGATGDWLTPLEGPKGPIRRFLRTPPPPSISPILFCPKDPPIGLLKAIPVNTDKLDIAFARAREILATTNLIMPENITKDEDEKENEYIKGGRSGRLLHFGISQKKKLLNG